MEVKKKGQVFTPKKIVEDILNVAGYQGQQILRKHVMDNSCGDGAFLVNIVERYIQEYRAQNGNLDNIEEELSEYIHGIEIEKDIYKKCLENLNGICERYHLNKIKWDILNKNTLSVRKYDKKMDFVLGNPPYVRVHNLEGQYKNVKKYKFAKKGMTDLYIVFFEIGLKMLKQDGILSYITPNSFYNSVACGEFRKYIQKNRNLEVIMELGHYQPFSVMTYTAITKFHNGNRFNTVQYYKYNLKTGRPEYKNDIEYNNLFINNNIVLATQEENQYKNIMEYQIKQRKTQVKNAFATLSDKIFINNNFNFDSNVIDVIKASTGEWKRCIYPYDKNGKVIPFENLDENLRKYLEDNKKALEKRSLEDKSKWYEFGRTQAIHDVQKDKISINTTIKDIESIKLSRVERGQGIYSGLYIITDVPYEEIEQIVKTQDFIDYVKFLNKCKSSGYYTFSSKDLSKYINYKLEEMGNEQ